MLRRAEAHLVVIAKSPVPGRVKTRLCPPFDHEQAARIAEAALSDTLAAVRATPAVARTLVLDGPVGPWLGNGVRVIEQRGAGLDERLAAAFTDCGTAVDAPVLVIGMDTPQVTPVLLSQACRLLTEPGGYDAVLGHATDGGWWALGFREVDASLVLGVPTSTSFTGRLQHRRLEAAGLRVARLPTLTDVDDAASAHRVAGQIPMSQFAAELAAQVVAA